MWVVFKYDDVCLCEGAFSNLVIWIYLSDTILEKNRFTFFTSSWQAPNLARSKYRSSKYFLVRCERCGFVKDVNVTASSFLSSSKKELIEASNTLRKPDSRQTSTAPGPSNIKRNAPDLTSHRGPNACQLSNADTFLGIGAQFPSVLHLQDQVIVEDLFNKNLKLLCPYHKKQIETVSPSRTTKSSQPMQKKCQCYLVLQGFLDIDSIC